MVKTGIKIFARLRPTKKPSGAYEVLEREDGLSALSFTVPRSESSGAINNRRETFTFRFTRVFDCQAGQEEVFNEVSRGVIDNCLEGYNGTIFAYGQTGSGKTFTITGGVERYSDRGLIPRSLSYLYQQYEKSPDTMFSTHISYLEIYNESGYDLLDPRHEAARLEDLPKVTLFEDRESVIHLRNLSLHPANNEEEALNWLFLGDTNRVMAETPMNMASTRSHCIFTIHISSRQPGSSTVRRAKLHLVDLAGSERVGRTGVEGTLLTEAKYINLSLHFLEQVIVALSEKSRSHIPYRNSMMTSVLRDSLGGNCMTSMIATCSVDKRNIDETISTCRFSQRVALVKNEATLNEEMDPKLMVQHLKQQVAELQDELSLVRGGEGREGELDPAERERCEQLVAGYLEDARPEATLLVGGDMRKIQLCFSLLKARVQTSSHVLPPPPTATPPRPQPSEPAVPDQQLKKLEEIIRQRDEEIGVLLKMLKQERQRVAELGERSGKGSEEERVRGEKSEERKKEENREGRGEGGEGRGESGEGRGMGGKGREVEKVESASAGQSEEHREKLQQEAMRQAWKAELSRARQEAFDSFRKECAKMAQVTQHKTALKAKYGEAKAHGEQVQTSRTAINKLKARLEKHRISRGLAGLTGGSVEAGPDDREMEIKAEIEAEKARFKSLYQTLRGMKTEIEHLQHLLERSKVEVQHEFEEWWQSQVSKTRSNRAAWQTPPTSTSSPQAHHHSQHTYQVDSSGHISGFDGGSGHSRSTTESSGHQYITKSSGHHSLEHYRATNISGHHTDSSGQGNVPLAYRTPRPLFPTQPTSPSTSSPTTSHPTSPPTLHPTSLAVPLTGDQKADADILAFYRARQRLIAKGPDSHCT